MRCTNEKKRARGLTLCVAAWLCITLTGCGSLTYEMAYNPDSEVSSFNVIARPKPGVADPFASSLCVVTQDVTDDENVDMTHATAAVLLDVNNSRVAYSKNAHERLYPASLTKVLTALVALKNGSGDQVLVASDAVNITERGAQLCGLKKGDTMTLDQALRVLLVYSANDVAMMIAENIGGTVDRFVEMMNEEASALGATNSHFVNPHGLTDENHYTTAYDLYLIFNEAVKNEQFREIINMTSYETTYTSGEGKEVALKLKTTNLYLRGNVSGPENVSVIGGKTGTTNAAGHCLMLYSKDIAGAPYISVILRSESQDLLYAEMTDLLGEIGK